MRILSKVDCRYGHNYYILAGDLGIQVVIERIRFWGFVFVRINFSFTEVMTVSEVPIPIGLHSSKYH
jgi:hypothetical protein